jgi:PAS domain S-box-containing protein
MGALPPGEALEAAPDAMVIVDDAGTISYVNSEAERLFGYARGELLGKAIEALVPAAARARHVAHREGYTKSPHTRPMGLAMNIVAQRKDGSAFPADVKLSPLTTPSGLFVTAAVRDITERIKTEQQLRGYAESLERLRAQLERKNVELEQRNRELEQFAYVSSHDLQEPLRKIVAFGDRLRSTSGAALDERGRDYLSRIQGAATRMQQLINDLLSFSRLTTKARPFEPVDLAKLVAGVASDLEVALERSGGRLAVGELGVIDGDASQLRQLIQNLIGNALKFHRKGVPPEVRVSGREVGEMYELRVEDNGIGIEPRFTERIFTVFERLHPRTEYEGTGIGLAVCKKIAERHGGEIRVESEPGRGSTFCVLLRRMRHEDSER